MTTQPPAQDVSGQGIGEPAKFLWLITPNDANELRFITRALRVGTAGDLAVRTMTGEVVTIPSCLGGEMLPIMCDKVYATNTTATNIMGLA